MQSFIVNYNIQYRMRPDLAEIGGFVAKCSLPRTLVGGNIPPPLQRRNGIHAALSVVVRGNVDLLEGPLVGFFCSQSAPGDAVLSTYDLAVALRESAATFIGGFQSPMEREFLAFLLRGSVGVVVCPARGISRMRLPGDGRLLVLSISATRYAAPPPRPPPSATPSL